MSITRINNNIAAMNAARNVFETGNKLQTSIERLSSGLRVNSAGDDAAGLTVAARLRSQINGLEQATANAQDGLNLINVAEGALAETNVRLNRIRTLAVQAANTGVNDVAARRSLQDEVFQSIDEITRIASTTQFGGNQLLSGDFSVQSGLKGGQQAFGVSLDPSPVASTLEDGLAFLNIKQLNKGEARIVTGDAPGGQQVMATAIVEKKDVAISNGFFTTQNSLGANATTQLGVATSFFNQVSIVVGATIAFDGVLADGVSTFTGSLVTSAGSTLTNLASAIQTAVSAAEQVVFGATVDTGFNVSAYAISGRIALGIAGTEQNFSQASLNISLFYANGDLKSTGEGVTRVTIDPAGSIGFNADVKPTAQIGNKVTAITGSTFASGEFAIHVADVQSAQQRTVKSTIAFLDANGSILDRNASISQNGTVNGRFEGGVYTGAASLSAVAGRVSTIELLGTNSDGTTFSREYSVGTTAAQDANNFDGLFTSVSGLIRELNSRRISAGSQFGFNGAVATLATDGTIRVIDELGRDDSKLSFTLVFNVDNGGPDDGALTASDEGLVEQDGFAESATIRVNGGQSIRAQAGEIVTLFGEDSSVEGVATPQVTMRMGTGLTAGTDTLVNTAATFSGTLNAGVAVTFQNGDQDVSFISGSTGRGAAQTLTVDFDATLDVTKATGSSDTGTTVLISTANTQLNFQVGAFANQNFRVSLGDLRSDALGFGRGSGRTVFDVNITSLEGANEALAIIDESLDQVNRTRSLLGAATNRLESTISNLSVTTENLTAAESRIMDADLARETTEFTLRQVQLQAGISVLAQANFQTQGFLALLG